jgi:hypothetical protein
LDFNDALNHIKQITKIQPNKMMIRKGYSVRVARLNRIDNEKYEISYQNGVVEKSISDPDSQFGNGTKSYKVNFEDGKSDWVERLFIVDVRK